MNRVVLIGRLTKEPELKYTNTGKAVTTFTLAVEQEYNTKEADFINIVTWAKEAENVAQYCGKGKQVAVAGRITTRNYENNEGRKVYVVEVTADKVKFLSDGKQTQQSGGGLLGGSTEVSIADTPFDF